VNQTGEQNVLTDAVGVGLRNSRCLPLGAARERVGEQVSHRLGWSGSKLSRIELHRSGVFYPLGSDRA